MCQGSRAGSEVKKETSSSPLLVLAEGKQINLAVGAQCAVALKKKKKKRRAGSELQFGRAFEVKPLRIGGRSRA